MEDNHTSVYEIGVEIQRSNISNHIHKNLPPCKSEINATLPIKSIASEIIKIISDISESIHGIIVVDYTGHSYYIKFEFETWLSNFNQLSSWIAKDVDIMYIRQLDPPKNDMS